MDKKDFIVKNCPNYMECSCPDISSCPIKNSINKCKEQIKIEENQRYKTNGYNLAIDILNQFVIEEKEG